MQYKYITNIWPHTVASVPDKKRYVYFMVRNNKMGDCETTVVNLIEKVSTFFAFLLLSTFFFFDQHITCL